MVPLSCLAESDAPILADTSAVISLDATGYFGRILESLPNRLAISEVVEDEVRRGEVQRVRRENAIWEIVTSGEADILALTRDALRRFRDLTSGAAVETLGDGEAATIACALERGSIALIDERKALRICSVRFPSLVTVTTLDVLAHPRVQLSLGVTLLSEAVFNALTRARMRVPPEYFSWVVDLIGPDNASKCNSLPRSVRMPGKGVIS